MTAIAFPVSEQNRAPWALRPAPLSRNGEEAAEKAVKGGECRRISHKTVQNGFGSEETVLQDTLSTRGFSTAKTREYSRTTGGKAEDFATLSTIPYLLHAPGTAEDGGDGIPPPNAEDRTPSLGKKGETALLPSPRWRFPSQTFPRTSSLSGSHPERRCSSSRSPDRRSYPSPCGEEARCFWWWPSQTWPWGKP